MYELQQYLVLGLVGSTLGSSVLLFTAFVLWIRSLKVDLCVYAPLVDGPRGKRPRR